MLKVVKSCHMNEWRKKKKVKQVTARKKKNKKAKNYLE